MWAADRPGANLLFAAHEHVNPSLAKIAGHGCRGVLCRRSKCGWEHRFAEGDGEDFAVGATPTARLGYGFEVFARQSADPWGFLRSRHQRSPNISAISNGLTPRPPLVTPGLFNHACNGGLV